MTDSKLTPKDSVHVPPTPQPTEPAQEAEKSKADYAGLLDEVAEKVVIQPDADYKVELRDKGRGMERGTPGMDR